MKLHFIDTDEAVVTALQRSFDRVEGVDVTHGDLLQTARECVVSPANSFGFMDGGFDKDLYAYFGPSIQQRVQEAVSSRPEGHLPVGASALIRTGDERIPFLIIAPTMTLPEQVDARNAYRAMRAVLRIARASESHFSHIYCPGLTTGVGETAPEEAAAQMARAYHDFWATEKA